MEGYMMQENLEGKIVLITGASSGIGRAIAEAFADEGTKLALCALPAERENLESVAAVLSNRAQSVITIPADLTGDEDLQTVVHEVRRRLGEVEVLINNAGTFVRNKVADSTLEEFDYCMRLNLRAPFFLSKQVIPAMVEHGWGRIINIGSSSAYEGFGGTSIYCASKHGLLGFSRAMCEELREAGVRVHIISPSDTDTPQYRRFFSVKDPLMLIAPEEIAQMVIFLTRYSGRGIIHEVRVGRMRR
jgi:NAD(P)-dependent dehydrogenase (short-subunit alcohol dehydrogenase family)